MPRKPRLNEALVQAPGTRLGTLLRPSVTLGDLAERAGVSYSLMAKISRGVRRPNERVKRAVEELLGVPAWQVFPPEKPAPRGEEEAP